MFLVIVLCLYCRFRKRLPYERDLGVSRDELAKAISRLKASAPQLEGNSNEMDLKKVIVSKFMKYLFSNYAKLALL